MVSGSRGMPVTVTGGSNVMDTCIVSPDTKVCTESGRAVSLLATCRSVIVGVSGAVTVTVTVSVSVWPVLSVTVSVKTRVAAAAGAVKLGVAVSAPVSVTVVPEVWVQA